MGGQDFADWPAIPYRTYFLISFPSAAERGCSLSCEPSSLRIDPPSATGNRLLNLPSDVALGSLRFLAGNGDIVVPHLLVSPLLGFHLGAASRGHRDEGARGRIRAGTRRAPAASPDAVPG
jgi:hypothetical protein